MKRKFIIFILLITFIIALSFSILFFNNKFISKTTVCKEKHLLINSSSTNDSKISNHTEKSDIDIKKESDLIPDNIVLKQGDKGDSISKLQSRLRTFGYNVDTDGDFGVTTLDAVLDFQYRLKLDTDGLVGESTIKQLNIPPTDKTKKEDVSVPTDNFEASNEQEKYINSTEHTSKTDYLIWLDIESQHVNIFAGSSMHWKLINRFVCASGTGNTPTVKGIYQVESKGIAFRAGSNCICKYYTGFYGNYLFHSVLLDNNGNITDDTLGTPASHGCVRLAIEDARYIYCTVPHYTTVISN